jgi:hypothetical protein
MTWKEFLANFGAGAGRVITMMTGPRLQLWAMVLGAPVMTALVYVWVDRATSMRWPVEHRLEQMLTLREAIRYGFSILGMFVLAIAAGLITGVKLQGPGGFSAEIDTADRTLPGDPIDATVQGNLTITPEPQEKPNAGST